GIMFGYACTETTALMPAPLHYAHQILLRMRDGRVANDPAVAGLLPDAKSQVTLKYVDGKPVKATSIVVSTQHEEGMDQADIKHRLKGLITDILPEGWMCSDSDLYVNPTGNFVIGGPDGDAGLTGRKIIVDTYGGASPHGGGAFSGKDPTKVDRSAAYGARWVAKNLVAAGMAAKCEIQVAYAIGVVKPVSVLVETFGTETIPVEQIEELINKHFDLSPFGIISALELRRPIYRQVAAFGHFGRHDLDLPWERTDRALDLAEEAGTTPMLAVAAG
ncbi:MAG: methionine adenosyltransferase, partial [Candidatus Dormibacteraeota bacterium]|nr:methionine adenosyltransferase [Candidatus Dormibacteraeota bacterium]